MRHRLTHGELPYASQDHSNLRVPDFGFECPIPTALHVFVIPGALLFFLAVHLWLVLKRGVSAPPVPGQAGRSEDV